MHYCFALCKKLPELYCNLTSWLWEFLQVVWASLQEMKTLTLPPGKVMRLLAASVSPSFGNLSTWSTMSAFTLPTTTSAFSLSFTASARVTSLLLQLRRSLCVVERDAGVMMSLKFWHLDICMSRRILHKDILCSWSPSYYCRRYLIVCCNILLSRTGLLLGWALEQQLIYGKGEFSGANGPNHQDSLFCISLRHTGKLLHINCELII